MPPMLAEYQEYPTNLLPLEATSPISPNNLPLWNGQMAQPSNTDPKVQTTGQMWTNQINHMYQPTVWAHGGQQYLSAPQVQYVWQWPQQQAYQAYGANMWSNNIWHQAQVQPQYQHQAQYYGPYAHWPQAVVTGFTYVINPPPPQTVPEMKAKEGEQVTSMAPDMMATPPTDEPDAVLLDQPDTSDKMVDGSDQSMTADETDQMDKDKDEIKQEVKVEEMPTLAEGKDQDDEVVADDEEDVMEEDEIRR